MINRSQTKNEIGNIKINKYHYKKTHNKRQKKGLENRTSKYLISKTNRATKNINFHCYVRNLISFTKFSIHSPKTFEIATIEIIYINIKKTYHKKMYSIHLHLIVRDDLDNS